MFAGWWTSLLNLLRMGAGAGAAPPKPPGSPVAASAALAPVVSASVSLSPVVAAYANLEPQG